MDRLKKLIVVVVLMRGVLSADWIPRVNAAEGSLVSRGEPGPEEVLVLVLLLSACEGGQEHEEAEEVLLYLK